MNAALMAQYVEFTADQLLLMMDYPKLFSAANPVSRYTFRSLMHDTIDLCCTLRNSFHS